MNYYTDLFEKETGLTKWLSTYSEKYKENREYLNPEYILWFNAYILKKIKYGKVGTSSLLVRVVHNNNKKHNI